MFQKPNTSHAADIVGIEHIDGLYSYALVLTRNRSEAEDPVGTGNIRSCHRSDGAATT